VRVRFVRESAPNNMLCVCRRHLSERQRIIGATVISCKGCGQWLYAISPRRTAWGRHDDGSGGAGYALDFIADRVLTFGITEFEMETIQREHLNPIEALLFLGTLQLPRVTVA